MSSDGAYYELLGVPRDATVADVKRAFRQKALAVHPDRNPDPSAHAAFQRLRDVHDVLIDEERRRLYDEGGEAAVNGEGLATADAAFWAHASAKVTKEDIEKYEREYPKSAEENDDLAEHYNRFEGNVRNVLDYVPFAEDKDITRFVGAWDAMIKDGRLGTKSAYKKARLALVKRSKRAAKRKALDRKCEQSKKFDLEGDEDEGGSSDDGDKIKPSTLVALLRERANQREENFNSWADSLAVKYKSRDKVKQKPKKLKNRKAKAKQGASSEPTEGEGNNHAADPTAASSPLRGGVEKKTRK